MLNPIYNYLCDNISSLVIYLQTIKTMKVTTEAAILGVGFMILAYQIVLLRLRDDKILAECKADYKFLHTEIDLLRETSAAATESRNLNESPFTCSDNWCKATSRKYFLFPKGVVIGTSNRECDYGNSILSVDRDGSNCPSGDGSVTFGVKSEATQEFASVTGGYNNTASAPYASVTGGSSNDAMGRHSSVSGGHSSKATQEFASVTGGYNNTASAPYASVTGGSNNDAMGRYSSVSGGHSNVAFGIDSSVSGGVSNNARNKYTSVSGGDSNHAVGISSSVAGGYYNDASGSGATVNGGSQNKADGRYSTVSGGLRNCKQRSNVFSVDIHETRCSSDGGSLMVGVDDEYRR